MTARERHREEVFSRDPHICALAKTDWGYTHPCRGRLQADHVLEVAWIEELHKRRLFQDGEGLGDLDSVIADGRNGWILCERHHQLKTAGLIAIPRSSLPQSVFDFTDDYDCAHLLEGRAAFATNTREAA